MSVFLCFNIVLDSKICEKVTCIKNHMHFIEKKGLLL